MRDDGEDAATSVCEREVFGVDGDGLSEAYVRDGGGCELRDGTLCTVCDGMSA